MGKHCARIGHSPDDFGIGQVLEDGIVGVDVAVQTTGFHCLHCGQRVGVALGIEHRTGLKGIGGISMHASTGRCRLRKVLAGEVDVLQDGIPRLSYALSGSVFPFYGHFVQVLVYDDAEVVLFRGVNPHHIELDDGTEEEEFSANTGGRSVGKIGLIGIESLQGLVYAANESVAGSPAVEIILVDALLPVHCHNQITVSRTGSRGSVFEDVGKSVGEI